jgi:hypothetical protein
VPRRGRLDCESPCAAKHSFCRILGIRPRTLLPRLRAFDLQAQLQRNPYGHVPTMLYQTVFTPNERRWEPEAICWFHLSRVKDPGSFEQHGIEPLSTRLNATWAMLEELDEGRHNRSQWQALRAAMAVCPDHSAWLYQQKVGQSAGEGPFAFLIREGLTCLGEDGSHDYLHCPEIIEDICDFYEVFFGLGDLLARFREATRPRAVKFIDRRPEKVMEIVAFYLFKHALREPARAVNSNFDSHGVAILPEDVREVFDPFHPGWRNRVGLAGRCAAGAIRSWWPR